MESIAVIQHHGRSDALAPLRIGHADNRTIGDRRMFAQDFLNLQGGYFVSPRLEDVDTRPAKNAIDTVLDDGSIASAKPSIAEGIACCLGLAPVFRKHARTADFDLARCSRGNRLAVVSNQLSLDAWQGRPDGARHALSP